MAVWNLGSVNADRVYRLPHLPEPGETLAAQSHRTGLGGKGANMSVAVARAGSRVHHIGAVGPDGGWMRDRLADYGVGVDRIATVDEVSGHAIIAVDARGENQIILYPGANLAIEPAGTEIALADATAGDIAVCQNETNAQAAFLEAAGLRGLLRCYAAAPFSVDAVAAALPLTDLLVLNAVEAAQLELGMDRPLPELDVADIVVTLGAGGCRWIRTAGGTVREFAAPRVEVVDTTGAGDTFTGYLLAALDQGMEMAQAIGLAQKAGALMVTRLGTADVIPERVEVENYFARG
ncbi:ribokinase [Pseudooceanicola batsensis HTCC2597]|uniref:Ribokinase n=1 Tax=Pseudooceanicola batsensis (strain ATCC BAA-863 / DSM 15984 / KCTC 12145 / HTCC2597) TaxID=252305 RepID=A3TWP6_PSEBH|nr:ribokinase [Pseudooceanicola batsensis]EAQ04042.1 ribokinase [Pseudooceanicola batsensis HTCC2597]